MTLKKPHPKSPKPPHEALRDLVEFKGIRRLSPVQYRDHIKRLYDGPAGAVLALGSLISLHEPLVGHLLRTRKFDVRAARNVLDVGSGAGQILGHLLQTVQPGARLVAYDLSHQMLKRARARLKAIRPHYIVGDVLHLPFVDDQFDCITCGWVLEHLSDPRPGLRELERVLRPGGSVLILTTEDTFSGAIVSRTWKCRTYNRRELKQSCEEAGLPWKTQLWFSRVHRFFKLGGILAEATKPESTLSARQGTSVCVSHG